MFLENLQHRNHHPPPRSTKWANHNAIIRHRTTLKALKQNHVRLFGPHCSNQTSSEIAEDLAITLIWPLHRISFDMILFYVAQLVCIKGVVQLCTCPALCYGRCITWCNPASKPDRCSYSEMLMNSSTRRTKNYDNFVKYRPDLVNHLNNMVNNPDDFAEAKCRTKKNFNNNYQPT
jgi:hypothetical protein